MDTWHWFLAVEVCFELFTIVISASFVPGPVIILHPSWSYRDSSGETRTHFVRYNQYQVRVRDQGHGERSLAVTLVAVTKDSL